MIRRLSTAGIVLLLLLHAPGVFALGRNLSEGQLITAESSAALPDRTGERVSRSEFLRRSVGVLYGTIDRTFSAPYENIPPEAATAIGVARVLGAVPSEWGSSGRWDTPVTRGELLSVLTKLGKVSPESGMASGFQDVRSNDAKRLVKLAQLWRLFEPLTPRTFGWSRAITEAEFVLALENFSEHVAAPLALPAEEARPPVDRSTLSPRERPVRGSTTPSKKKGTVTIETGSVDSSHRLNKTTLPRNDLLETVWGLVQQKFLYEDRINQEEIAYSIAETILQKLNDPYTTFFRPTTNQRFQEQIQGNNSFSGIGAHVQIHPEGGVEVVTPIQGSPAMKAGVKAGDRITAVDDVSVEKMSLEEAVNLIRGPEGSTVRLTIVRKDAGGTMVISVVRGQIVLKDLVLTEQEGIAIVRLNNFSREAMNEINTALADVMAKKPLGLVLDMRNNPGGLLDAAILISSHFLKEGDSVVTVARKSAKEEYRAVGGQRSVPMDLAVIVLVNKGSASASEIVAGALKDHKRAEIMGQTTFGKGTVQEAIEFASEGGKSPAAVKITVAKWLTPGGHEINGKGVEPTIIFPETQQGDRDEMLLEAIRIIKAKKGR